MTLIFNVIHDRWTLQASDRLTSLVDPNGTISPADPEQNKAIFVAERMTFAYTGHAFIQGTDTAEWFQNQLGREFATGASADEAVDAVVSMADAYFRALRADDKRHAFVAVGWSNVAPHQRRPFIRSWSNFTDTEGNARPDVGAFEQHAVQLEHGERYALTTAGVSLSEQALNLLHAQVGAQVEQDDHPGPVARLLIDTIRAEADQLPERGIGKGIMVNCLPHSPGPSPHEIMLIGKLPDHEVRTFTYVPPDTYDGRYLGPLVVGSDGSQMGHFETRMTGLTEDGGGEGNYSGFGYRAPGAPVQRQGKAGQRINVTDRPGRNAPCWCGSGDKYKKCHGK